MEEFPKLVNSQDESVITINNSSFSIGRSLSCDHIIQALGVSRFHCIIKKVDDYKWTLYDRSTNGTFVNSTLFKFNESVDLKNGDVIKLGPDNLDFVFQNFKETCRDLPKSTPRNDDAVADSITTGNQSVVLDDEVAILAQEFEQPFEMEVVATNSTKQSTQEQKENQNVDIMENELTCSICSELFIKAVTLNCSHTYCKFCIEQWKKNKSNCPICRQLITTVAPTLVLDNFIEKFITTQTDEVKETRKALVQQRNEVIVNAASSSNMTTQVNEADGLQIIEIYSENEDDEENEDNEEDSDYSDFSADDYDCDVYDNYFESRPYVSRGRYYGGYGKCFICNQTGHWANSCPFKRR